jgi:hypothetical protein
MADVGGRHAKQAKDALVEELSREFGRVVARIRDHWNDVPVRELASEAEAAVEAAERGVDQTASDLLEGACGRSAWSQALSDYERAWSRVFGSLGERRN